jgi:hypothetical protein
MARPASPTSIEVPQAGQQRPATEGSTFGGTGAGAGAWTTPLDPRASPQSLQWVAPAGFSLRQREQIRTPPAGGCGGATEPGRRRRRPQPGHHSSSAGLILRQPRQTHSSSPRRTPYTPVSAGETAGRARGRSDAPHSRQRLRVVEFSTPHTAQNASGPVPAAWGEGAAGRGGDGGGDGDGRGPEGRSDAPQSRQRLRSPEFDAPQSTQIVSGLGGTVATMEVDVPARARHQPARQKLTHPSDDRFHDDLTRLPCNRTGPAPSVERAPVAVRPIVFLGRES